MRVCWKKWREKRGKGVGMNFFRFFAFFKFFAFLNFVCFGLFLIFSFSELF